MPGSRRVWELTERSPDQGEKQEEESLGRPNGCSSTQNRASPEGESLGHGTSTVHSSAIPHAPGRLEPASNLCEEGLKDLLADVVGAHLLDLRKTLGPSVA